MSTAAAKAALNGDATTEGQTIAKYLHEVLKLVDREQKAAMAAAELLKQRGDGDHYTAPFPTGWIMPDLASITDRYYTADVKRKYAFPAVFIGDVEYYNRDCLPCCDQCGLNTGGSGKGVTHKRLHFKRVHYFNTNYFVLYRSYRCTREECPGVQASKAKWEKEQDAKVKKGITRDAARKSHDHIYSILCRPTYDLLHEDLKELFPAHVKADLTMPRVLMDKVVMNLAVAVISESNGLSGAMFAKAIQECHHADHGSNALSFYSRASDHAEWVEKCRLKGTNRTMPEVTLFGDWGSKLHQRNAPSAKVVWSNVAGVLTERKAHSQSRLAMMSHWDGIVKGDATFNFVKQIAEGGKGKPFEELYDLETGHGIVLNAVLCPSSTDTHKTVFLTEMCTRAVKKGCVLDLLFTDNCCKENNLWTATLGSLVADMAEARAAVQAKSLQLPDIKHGPPTLVSKYSAVGGVVETIRQELSRRPPTHQVIGLDIENTPIIVSGARPPHARTDTVQIAVPHYSEADADSPGMSWVFHTRSWLDKGMAMPPELAQLLADADVVKAGHSISRDVTYMQKTESWGPNLEVNNVRDVGKEAKAAGLVPTAKAGGLSRLARVVLPAKKPMDKAEQVGCYCGNSLTKSQVGYAAMDAAVSVELDVRIQELQAQALSNVGVNDSVIVFDRTGTNRVVYGTVVKVHSPTKRRPCNKQMEDEITVVVTDTLVSNFIPEPADRNGGELPMDGTTRMKGPNGRALPMEKLSLAEIEAKARDALPTTFVQHEVTVKRSAVRCRLEAHDRWDEVIEEIATMPMVTAADWEKVWIKLDAFHAQDRLRHLSKRHGAFKRFAAALRDAIFSVSPEAAEKIKTELRDKRGMSYEEAELYYITNDRHFTSKVERKILDPDTLVEAMEDVRAIFADCIDSETKKPLFSKEVHEEWEALMFHVRKGCLSDKPGVPLYYHAKGKGGKDGPLRCRRGTSQLEALHYHLRRLLHGAHNIGQIKAVLMLAEYITRYNSRQAHRSHGGPDYRWYDFGKMEKTVELAANCGVKEYPYLELTSEYAINTDDTFYVVKTASDENEGQGEEATVSSDDLTGELDEDGNMNEMPQLFSDGDDDDDEDDAELGGVETEHERVVREEVARMVRSTTNPMTRAEAAKLGRDPTPASITPSQVNPSGGESLVVPGNLTVYEWRTMRLLAGKAMVASSLESAGPYVQEWNSRADRAAAQGRLDGVSYLLRRLNAEIAVKLSTIERETSRSRATTRPIYNRLQELQKKFRVRDEAANFEATVVESPSERQDTPAQGPTGKSHASSAPERKQQPKKRMEFRCGTCNHYRNGDLAARCGTKDYHPTTKGKKGQKKVCLLADQSEFHGVGNTMRRTGFFQLDPAWDPADATKLNLKMVTSRCGCQYCQRELRHPEHPPVQDGVVVEDEEADATAMEIEEGDNEPDVAMEISVDDDTAN